MLAAATEKFIGINRIAMENAAIRELKGSQLDVKTRMLANPNVAKWVLNYFDTSQCSDRFPEGFRYIAGKIRNWSIKSNPLQNRCLTCFEIAKIERCTERFFSAAQVIFQEGESKSLFENHFDASREYRSAIATWMTGFACDKRVICKEEGGVKVATDVIDAVVKEFKEVVPEETVAYVHYLVTRVHAGT